MRVALPRLMPITSASSRWLVFGLSEAGCASRLPCHAPAPSLRCVCHTRRACRGRAVGRIDAFRPCRQVCIEPAGPHFAQLVQHVGVEHVDHRGSADCVGVLRARNPGVFGREMRSTSGLTRFFERGCQPGERLTGLHPPMPAESNTKYLHRASKSSKSPSSLA